MVERGPEKRTSLARRANHLAFAKPCQDLLKNINRFAPPPNQHYCLRVPFHMRGVSRSSRTLVAECGGRGGSQCVFSCTDERPVADGQVVWFWHPDAGVKFATALARRVDDGGQKARRTRESTKQLLKPSRREGRDVSAEPVVTAACFLCCRRAMGAASSRPSLRPLYVEGGNSRIARTHLRRETASCCLLRHCERSDVSAIARRATAEAIQRSGPKAGLRRRLRSQ
jgi:hypothetical protein